MQLCAISLPLQFALRASRGDELPVHGDGNSHRSFLYVEDVAEAFDVVLHKVSCSSGVSSRSRLWHGQPDYESRWTVCRANDQSRGGLLKVQINHIAKLDALVLQGNIGEIYNIGTQKERTVMDVARQICKHFKMPEVRAVRRGLPIGATRFAQAGAEGRPHMQLHVLLSPFPQEFV